MSKFLIRRLLLGIFIIIMGSLVFYSIIRCLPASYVEKMARQFAASTNGRKTYQEWLAELNHVYGMDSSILSGFLKWGSNAIRGNFGDSWKYMRPVTEIYSESVWWSVLMNIITFILEIVVCIPLGILAARKQYSKTDYAITVFALACISLPSFYLATLLKYFLSVKLGWFPLYGLTGRMYNSMTTIQKMGDVAYHLVLPVLTLAMLSIGGLMRYTRTNMLEVLSTDYIRTARAKGLPEKVVINKHAFRNTLIPLVSYMSYLLPNMFGGAMITEEIFQIPGIGRLAYQAMITGDIPFAMFYTVFLMTLTQVSLIIADIMYAVVDPRVRIN